MKNNLIESIEILNDRLKNTYGRFHGRTNPLYRIVWSEDEIEKRWVSHSPEGLELSSPRVEERPKYKQYIHEKYILERMVLVPQGLETDLLTDYSYEPIWTFEDKDGNYLPPRWDVISIVINSIHKAAMGSIGKKYKDEDSGEGLLPDEFKAREKMRLDKLQDELFGNETRTGDSLAHQEGISVPHNYGMNNEKETVN